MYYAETTFTCRPIDYYLLPSVVTVCTMSVKCLGEVTLSGTVCVVDVVEEMSLNVDPSGDLEEGMSVMFSCSVRYGAPAIDSSQEPALTLSLANGRLSVELTGETYYHAPHDTDELHTKTVVTTRWPKTWPLLSV